MQYLGGIFWKRERRTRKETNKLNYNALESLFDELHLAVKSVLGKRTKHQQAK